MIYVTSDLHGYPVDQFEKMLKRAGFGKDDFLFVLGDVIDRGKYGAELLLWLTQQSNVQLILGNHEAMLLSCRFAFEEVNAQSLARLNMEKIRMLQNWMMNGAQPTLDGLKRILKEDPEVLEGIVEYLQDAPLYERVQAGGHHFVLVHAGLENFRPDRPMEDYSPDELLWCRPEPDTDYGSGATVVFGHTPTEFYGEQYRGKAVRTRSWICIDTGAAMGNSPMLLRLDDGKEFYA